MPSPTHGLGRHEEESSLPLWVNGAAARLPEIPGRLQLKGWKIEPGASADPGASAEMALTLRPANYQLMIVLSSKQDKPPTSNDLTVKLNGHPMRSPAPLRFRPACIQRPALPRLVRPRQPNARILTCAEPVRIGKRGSLIPLTALLITLVREAVAARSRFCHRVVGTGWVRYVLCGAMGGILFGLFAPLVVLLFTGSQTSNQDPAYDLDRFKGEPKQQQSTASQTSEEIDLSVMEAKLAEGLEPASDSARAASSAATCADRAARRCRSTGSRQGG